MSNLTEFRCRWLDWAGFAVLEKRHTRKVFGFFPVHEWEAVAHFRSVGDGLKWVMDRKSTTHNPDRKEAAE